MNVLHLTLKKQWFDMIASGEKKEEYREIKDYWWKRLLITYPVHPQPSTVIAWAGIEHKRVANIKLWSVSYDIVTAKNGYAKDAPTIRWQHKGIRIGEGRPEWGAEPGKQYFILEIGDLI